MTAADSDEEIPLVLLCVQTTVDMLFNVEICHFL